MSTYLDVLVLVEKLHSGFLDVMKLELDILGIQEINNVQSLLVYNIGDTEMTIGELTLRDCYLGTNVSYNVKKLVEKSYLVYEKSVHDRRSRRVKLTGKGQILRGRIAELYERHINMLTDSNINQDDLNIVGKTMDRIHRLWMRAHDTRPRPAIAALPLVEELLPLNQPDSPAYQFVGTPAL